MVPPRSLRNIKRTKRYVTATVTRELGGTLGALEYASETKRAAYIGYLAGERSNAGRALVRVGLGGVRFILRVRGGGSVPETPTPRGRAPRTADRAVAGGPGRPIRRGDAGTRPPPHPPTRRSRAPGLLGGELAR